MLTSVWLSGSFAKVAHDPFYDNRDRPYGEGMTAHMTRCGLVTSTWEREGGGYRGHGIYIRWKSLDHREVRLCRRCYL
jgi:hypothetical protein